MKQAARQVLMEEYRIDFKCPRCKKIVSLGSDWAFELNEVLYCPACEYPAFKLVAAYSESPYQQTCLTTFAPNKGQAVVVKDNLVSALCG